MSNMGQGPRAVVAQAGAWQTVMTVILSPGGLWIWVAAPQKFADHLPCVIALPH